MITNCCNCGAPNQGLRFCAYCETPAEATTPDEYAGRLHLEIDGFTYYVPVYGTLAVRPELQSQLLY